MPAEVNGNHALAQFNRARVFLHSQPEDYSVCGKVVMTPNWAFLSGHGNSITNYEPVVSIAVPKEDIRLIVDHSVEACETHDKMDAEAKAQMEANAKETTKN